MSKVAIVTDSTSYIPKDLRAQYPIFVVPTVLNWGDQSYRDGVDIQATHFFERLKTDPVHPSTSVPSLGEMKEVYAKAAESVEAVVGVHISAKLSNTYAVAREASGLLPGKDIRVVDSQTTSMAMGFLVLAAGRAAAEGKSADEIVQLVEAALPRVGIVLTPETLTYLQRGGRIGSARAFLGNLLDSKPLLEVRDGEIKPLERVRSKKKAMGRLVEVVCERLAGKSSVRLAAIHANAAQEATEMLEAARAKLGNAVAASLVADVSPTVAVHTGPGTVGLTYSEGF
jgi:DegV family protein with EDD domain